MQTESEIHPTTPVDDARLIQLAADPSLPLFPVLERVTALTPLLVVLAVVPGLYALEYAGLTEAGALWGMRALEVSTADSFEKFFDPSRSQPTHELKWQNPAGAWLTAACFHALGSQSPVAQIAVSYVSSALSLGVLFALLRLLGGLAFAFWGTLLTAAHGPFIAEFANPAPNSLAVFFALATYWGFLAHLRDPTQGPVSWRLMLSGIALGGCLLSGGPLSFAAIAVLLVHVLGLRGQKTGQRRMRETPARRIWEGWPALKSLLVLLATAFAIGGWWILMMMSRYGGEFWTGWLTGIAAPLEHASSAVIRFEEDRSFTAALARFVDLTGLLIGPALLGLWQAVRDVSAASDETRRRSQHFLLAWLLSALFVWISIVRSASIAHHTLDILEMFLLLPCVVLAARGLNMIVDRQVGSPAIAGLVVLSVCVWAARSLALGADRNELSRPVWWLLSCVLVLAVWALVENRRGRDRVLRFPLTTLVLLLLAAHVFTGMASLRKSDPDYQTLRQLRHSLRAVEPIDSVLLVAEGTVPLRLQYLARSIQPETLPALSSNWEAALAQVAEVDRKPQVQILLLDWNPENTRPSSMQVPGVRFLQVRSPQSFGERELRAFLVSSMH